MYHNFLSFSSDVFDYDKLNLLNRQIENPLKDIDIVKEYELILKKQSNLSKKKRDMICRIMQKNEN